MSRLLGRGDRVQTSRAHSDGEGSDNQYFVISVEFVSGLEELFSEEGILIYPNPTEGSLYIQNPSSDRFSYNIYNINGKLVANEQHISGSGREVNLSNLSKGVYFVKLITTEQTETHKVILK